MQPEEQPIAIQSQHLSWWRRLDDKSRSRRYGLYSLVGSTLGSALVLRSSLNESPSDDPIDAPIALVVGCFTALLILLCISVMVTLVWRNFVWRNLLEAWMTLTSLILFALGFGLLFIYLPTISHASPRFLPLVFGSIGCSAIGYILLFIALILSCRTGEALRTT